MLVRMDHFTVVTDKLAETRAFYTTIGMTEGLRPDFGLSGAWFYLHDHPVLHVIENAVMPNQPRGVLDHMAYFGTDFIGTTHLLETNKIPYRVIRTPRPYSVWQVFFHDPNGAEIEIDFAKDEVPPSNWKDNAASMPR